MTPAPDPGAPAVLVLVRHGRTPLTAEQRFCGAGGADPDLSDPGRREAARVADLLAEGLGTPPAVGPVGAVVCSPLVRARRTAAVVGDRLGLAVVTDDEWREMSFGDWDGLGYAEVAERWPAQLRAWQSSPTVAPPGGESPAELGARVRAARARLVAEHPGRTVVVVTHAAPVRAAVQEALDAGPAALWRTRVSTGSITVVRYWRDGGVEVVTVNRLP